MIGGFFLVAQRHAKIWKIVAVEANIGRAQHKYPILFITSVRRVTTGQKCLILRLAKINILSTNYAQNNYTILHARLIRFCYKSYTVIVGTSIRTCISQSKLLKDCYWCCNKRVFQKRAHGATSIGPHSAMIRNCGKKDKNLFIAIRRKRATQY